MLTIQKSQVTLVVESKSLIVEASDIGLTAGQEPPMFIAVLDDTNTKQGMLFGYWRPDVHNDEVTGWFYQCGMAILLVIND